MQVGLRGAASPGSPSILNFSHVKSDTIPIEQVPRQLKILHSWTFPEHLKRVTGFDFVSPRRIACIQENTGIIYLFNILTGRIDKEVPFGPPADYQSICIVRDDAYVVSADGRILRVENYLSPRRTVREFGTHLTIKNNASGIAYDRRGRRLLISIRGVDDASSMLKGIYAFDLAEETMSTNPVVKIHLTDSVFNSAMSRRTQQMVQPTDIALHEGFLEYILCDAIKSQLLVVTAEGEIREVYRLDREEIIQPEGVRFTPSGELYVVSAGFKEEPGKLLLIESP